MNKKNVEWSPLDNTLPDSPGRVYKIDKWGVVQLDHSPEDMEWDGDSTHPSPSTSAPKREQKQNSELAKS